MSDQSLEIRNASGVLVVNSRVIADLFGKRHDNVLRDIDALASHASNLRDGAGGLFFEVKTPHPTVSGRTDRSFDMNRDGFSLLAMGFTGAKALEWKLLFIDAFNKMEGQLRAAAPPVQLNDPHVLRAALLGYTERVIALETENATLGAKVEHLAPKAAALDLITNKSGAENISTTAKGLRMRPGDLFAFLDNKGWVFRARDGAPWRAYQTKIDVGYLTVRETPDRTRDDRSFMQVLITPKGRAKLAEMLAQGDMLRPPGARKAA